MEGTFINYTNNSPDTTYDVPITLTQRELFQLADLLCTVCKGKYFANYLDETDMSARDLCVLMSAVDTILTTEWGDQYE